MTEQPQAWVTFQERSAELDRAASNSSAAFEIASEIGWYGDDINAYSNEVGDSLAALLAAFQYSLRRVSAKSNQSPFVSLFTLEDGKEIPPRPREVKKVWKEEWATSLAHTSHPAIRSRLADLLFESRFGNVGEFGKKAIDAYIEQAKIESWSPLDRARGLERANEIAAVMRDKDSTAVVLLTMSDFASFAISINAGPGVYFGIVEHLLASPEHRARALEILDSALLVYADDPYNVEQILMLRRSNSEASELKTIDTQRVSNWLNAAENSQGVDRLFNLERAAKIADEAGLTDQRDAARVLLQRINRDDLGLRTIRRSFDLPRDVVEEYLAQFLIADNWQDALVTLALHSPLTGDYSENLNTIEEMYREAPIFSGLRRVKLGGDGLPRWQPQTEEEEQDDKLTQHEVFRLQIAAPLYAEGLQRVGDHYRIAFDELLAYLRDRPSISPKSAWSLAEAFRLFWEGSYNSSAHIGLWQVEAVARDVLLSADQAVYSLQRKKRPGQYMTLGSLIKDLAKLGIDESWYRYLWTVFASPAGMNLRNEVAHGFAGELSQVEAAIILHAASYLTLLRAAN